MPPLSSVAIRGRPPRGSSDRPSSHCARTGPVTSPPFRWKHPTRSPWRYWCAPRPSPESSWLTRQGPVPSWADAHIVPERSVQLRSLSTLASVTLWSHASSSVSINMESISFPSTFTMNYSFTALDCLLAQGTAAVPQPRQEPSAAFPYRNPERCADGFLHTLHP